VKRYFEATLAAAEKEGKVETLYTGCAGSPTSRARTGTCARTPAGMAIKRPHPGHRRRSPEVAMIAVDRRLKKETRTPGSLTVHGRARPRSPEAEVEAVAKAVKEEMEGVAELAVPLVVDVGWGKSWYEAKA